MHEEAPAFRKPDRYKTSSYRAYNFKLPRRYDSSVWMTLCQTSLWDRTVISAVGSDLESLAILDVGCATGRLLLGLATAGATRLFGVDLAPNIVAVAREKLAERRIEAELRVADAEDALPWPDGSFDVVALTGVLHHFYRPFDALAEIRRVLRPGGQLLVLDPQFFTPLRQVLNLFLRLGPHDGDYRFYSARGAMRLLDRGGFSPSGPRRVGLWAYLIRGIKSRASVDAA